MRPETCERNKRSMQIPLFDAHCDTATELLKNGGSLKENSLHVDLDRAGKFSPCAQVFAIWAEPGRNQVYEDTMALIKRQIWDNGDMIALCRSAPDARAAARAGKAAAFVSIEGSEVIDCDENRLRAAYDDGLRIAHLCWNFDNPLCGAAMDSGAGLTEKGREFVKTAWELGVLIDLSHISEAAFWDILEMGERPVIAGHSNSRALCDHPRNLTDEQFRALAKSGGCAGINFCTDFLGLGRDIEAVALHIERFLELGGPQSVCIGADWDGIPELPAGITGIQDMDKLWELLLRRGHSEELLRGIFYDNLMSIMEKSL